MKNFFKGITILLFVAAFISCAKQMSDRETLPSKNYFVRLDAYNVDGKPTKSSSVATVKQLSPDIEAIEVNFEIADIEPADSHIKVMVSEDGFQYSEKAVVFLIDQTKLAYSLRIENL